jgi:hypothetical protein
MDAASTTSLITAGAALCGSVGTAALASRNQSRLALLEQRLDIGKSEHLAFLDYRYEARKHLYAELLPLMFVLVEQCDDAYWRIRGIARNASEGRLGDTDNRLFIKGPERIDGRGRRDERIDDYFISTIYRLLAPCVTFQICQERLTSTDLSADEYVARIYWLARLLRRTWNSADEIARIETGERLNKTDAKRAHREQVNLRDVDRPYRPPRTVPARFPGLPSRPQAAPLAGVAGPSDHLRSAQERQPSGQFHERRFGRVRVHSVTSPGPVRLADHGGL